MQKIKLDKKDFQILFQLELDARQSLSYIAKKVKLSKQVVKYRIDKLVKQGVIEKFVLMINGPKIGYVAYKFYLQLRNINQEEFNQLVKELIDHPYLIWVTTCDGRYDIILAPIARNNVHAYNIMQELITKYNKWIKELVPLNYIDVFHQKRTYFVNKKREDEPAPFWGDEPQNYPLDNYEVKILTILCENARESVLKIAQKIGCSVDIVNYRLKKLIKDKIIQGSRIMINKNLLGYQYHKVVLNVRFDSPEIERKFFTYLNNTNQVINIIRMMGEWNLELDVDVKTSAEFHELIMSLKDKFSTVIQNYESLLIFKQHKYNFFPMGEKYNHL